MASYSEVVSAIKTKAKTLTRADVAVGTLSPIFSAIIESSKDFVADPSSAITVGSGECAKVIGYTRYVELDPQSQMAIDALAAVPLLLMATYAAVRAGVPEKIKKKVLSYLE